jgi:hypothetical protein
VQPLVLTIGGNVRARTLPELWRAKRNQREGDDNDDVICGQMVQVVGDDIQPVEATDDEDLVVTETEQVKKKPRTEIEPPTVDFVLIDDNESTKLGRPKKSDAEKRKEQHREKMKQKQWCPPTSAVWARFKKSVADIDS